MKLVRLISVFFACSITLSFAQSIPLIDLTGGFLKTVEIPNSQLTKPSPATPASTNATIALSYYDTSTTAVRWIYPANYGSFLMLYLAQRFTTPGTGGFIDSISVRIDEVSSGFVQFRVLDVIPVNFPDGRQFYLPNFNVPLGDTLIPGTQFTEGQMTTFRTVHLTGGKWQVPKQFFLTVEFTVDQFGFANQVTMVTDSKNRTSRSSDSSRSIMIFQTGNQASATIMDSIFTLQATGQLLYPNLYLTAYISTTDPLAPVITSNPPTTAQVGKVYSYSTQATGSPSPTFSLIRNPAGMSIIPISGQILWQPTPMQVGVHSVIVRATNSKGIYDQAFDITVSPGPGAPKITSTPVLTGSEGVLYTYQVTTSGTPAPTFSLLKKPSGMTIGSSSGLISWTPTAAHIGNDSVTVRATNIDGIDDQSFVIVVTGTSAPPVFTSAAPVEAIADQEYRYNADATGKPEPRYRLIQGPTGMVIDSISGVITWTPKRDQKGLNAVTIRAVNSLGAADQQFNIDVFTSPKITSTAPAKAKAGVLYSYDITADANPAARFKITTSLPQGMTLDSISGALRWTPTEGNVGSVLVNVRATNRAGFQNQVFTIIVETAVGVEQEATPSLFTLDQNYPNPFSTTTSIGFRIEARSRDQNQSPLSLRIFNALGREVATVVPGAWQSGDHTIVFDASDLPAGLYFYQLRAGAQVQTQAMHLMR